MKYKLEKDIWVSVGTNGNLSTNAVLVKRDTILEYKQVWGYLKAYVAKMPEHLKHLVIFFDPVQVQEDKEWFSLWQADPKPVKVPQKIEIQLYHGSMKERVAVERLGYHVNPGDVFVTNPPLDGDPFEIARRIYDDNRGSVYVAIRPFTGDPASIIVSDDCFHQR